MLPSGTPKSLAEISLTSVAEAESSPITSLRAEKIADAKSARQSKGLRKGGKQPKVAKAVANNLAEVISPI